MNLKEWTISYIDSLRESQITETLKITRQSKDYATGPDFTVFKVDGLPQFSINVNSSAGWSTDPHDKRGRELRLMDRGNRRATLYWKEGNLKALAKQMYDLTSETTWGEDRGLTPDDYYKVLKMWVDMGLHESTNKPNLVEKLNTLLEKNVPTNPSKWSYYKSQAKKKFDVYPSAYANAWAAKKYKAAGGGWKKESVNEWTDRNFYMSQPDMNLSLLKKIMPSVVGSAKSAEQRLKQFVGGQMWVHGQHHNIIGKDGKKYEIGQNQYYLGKGTNVNATSATFKKILPDGDTEVIGTLYVDTDDLLKAIKKQGIKESVNEIKLSSDEKQKLDKAISITDKVKAGKGRKEAIMYIVKLAKEKTSNYPRTLKQALYFLDYLDESINEAKFKYDPKIDYFDEYELLPQEVQDVLDAHDFDDDSYAAAKKTIKQLNKVGWTADYELSGDMTDLKPLGESINEVDSTTNLLNMVQKFAKIQGFKSIKNPEKWIKKNGPFYYENGIVTLAIFIHPDTTNDFRFAQVYHEQDTPEDLFVHFHSGGSSLDYSIEDWTTSLSFNNFRFLKYYWKDYFKSINEVSWSEMEKIDTIQKQIKKHIQVNHKDSIDYKRDRWMKGYSDLVGHSGKGLNKKNLKNIAKLAKQKNDKKLMKLLSDLTNI